MKTRFGLFIVDSDTRQLLRDGTEVRLSTKAFDLLCILLGRRPNVVVKDDLLQHIWPDSYVSEANLNVLVGEIRKAIGDNAQSSQFIRTVHGVGYAFSGNATEQSADTAQRRLIGQNRVYVLSPGENIVGRDPSCNVWLDDPDVSRRHARIRIEGTPGKAVLDDLESTNGTFVGRSRVKSVTVLADGDVIRFGPVELKFRDGSDTTQQTRRIRRKVR